MVGEEKSLAFLAALSRKKQLAFALLVFERLLPSLISFSKDTGFDNSYCLQSGDAVWSAMQNGVDSTLIRSFNETCLKNAPDTEEFSHELTSSALNSVLAISEIMEFELDGSIDHIVNVSTLARDSVYLYLSNLEHSVVSSSEEDERIAADPLMQQELRREEEDIKFLVALPDNFDNETISTLRARSSSQPPILPHPR